MTNANTYTTSFDSKAELLDYFEDKHAGISISKTGDITVRINRENEYDVIAYTYDSEDGSYAYDSGSSSFNIGISDIDDGAITAAKIATGAVTNTKLGAAAVTATKINFFKSTEQTGTGSEQSIAHGLGSTPGLVIVTVTKLHLADDTFVEGTHDGTNVKVTVASGSKYKVVAIA